jgi:RNA polymerase sigma factor (sigma-70 family)
VTVAALYTSHIGIAVTIAQDYRLAGAGQDDVHQEARIGLWIAARQYDPNRGVPFRSFAGMVIRRRLQDKVGAANARKHRLLTDAHREALVEGQPVPILDTLVDPHGLEELVERRERLRQAIADPDSLRLEERRRRTWRESKRRCRARAA